MWHPDHALRLANERTREIHDGIEHARLVAQLRGTRFPLRRRAAGALGEMLLRLGTSLRHYGHRDPAAVKA